MPYLDFLQVSQIGRFHGENVGVIPLEFVSVSFGRFQVSAKLRHW